MTVTEEGRWFVYLLRCADDSLYCGITTDISRRLRQHNGDIKGGARYTQVRRPVKLAYLERHGNRSAAAAREYAVKRLPATVKRDLCRTANIPQNLRSLSPDSEDR